jgi:hypothetical protein
MSDDELRRLMSDAVSDIDPQDRLDEIRASVTPDSKVVPMARSRWGRTALAGIVGTAAVIGVVAYATGALPGMDKSGNVAPMTTIGGTDRPHVPGHSPSRSSSGSSTSTPRASTGTKAYAVYYLGSNPVGNPVLFREFHRGPDWPASDPGGGQDVLTEAVQDAVDAIPFDPDYQTPWHGLATLDYASYDSTGAGYTLQIAFKDGAPAHRPAGMTAREAKAAIQQLVYTAQAAIGKRAPVTFTVGRHPPGRHPTLLGVDISRPIPAAPILETLALVNISSPNEGQQVSGRLTVTGVANTFEGNVLVRLERGGRQVEQRATIAGMGVDRMFPWSVKLNLTDVTPGKYTLVATDGGDAAGKGHAWVDSRTIIVK